MIPHAGLWKTLELDSHLGGWREEEKECFNLETWLLYSNQIFHEASAIYEKIRDES